MIRVGLVVLVCVAAGCSRLHAPPAGDVELFEPGAPNPFAPVSLQISPLTRIEPGPQGEPVLAVYLRLVDEWGDGVKAPALFLVQLFRVRGTSGLAEREQGWTWEIDLRDPDANSGWFDATGLYRLPLADVPAWVLEPERPDEVLRLTVIADTPGPRGRVVKPRDSFDKNVTPWDGR